MRDATYDFPKMISIKIIEEPKRRSPSTINSQVLRYRAIDLHILFRSFRQNILKHEVGLHGNDHPLHGSPIVMLMVVLAVRL